MLKHLILILLVCKIFSWGCEGPNNVLPEINSWLKDKNFIAAEQSSLGDGGYRQTYLTIFAETDYEG